MPTPAGTIRFSQIESEFGRNGSKSLGSYRISQSAGLYSNLPLDDGVQNSVAVGNSAISFGQLSNKRLNIVVDISGQTEYRVNMRSKYDSNIGVTVIGGFIGKPADPSEKRIKVSVNETIGSDAGSGVNTALRTGTWGTSTFLEVLLGPSAAIIGAGGAGGIEAGAGGNGGAPGSGQQAGQGTENQGGGGPGSDGYAIVVNGPPEFLTLINNGTFIGGIAYNVSPG